MAIIINKIGSDKFSLNGKTYSRIFQPLAAGINDVAIYNTYDTRLQILAPTHYSEFVVDSTMYVSQASLIEGLLQVVFAGTGGGNSSKPIEVLCEDLRATINKTGTTVEGNYVPDLWDEIYVTFTGGTSASSPTLSIDGGDHYPLMIGNRGIGQSGAIGGALVSIGAIFYFNGTEWQLYGAQQDTQVPVRTLAQLETGTLTGTGQYSPLVLNQWLDGKDFQPKSEKGVANGYVPLGADNKVPAQYLSDAVVGQLHYGGTYNGTTVTASTNNPELQGLALPSFSLYPDTYFICSGSFTNGGNDYLTGDWIISTGVSWVKIDNTDAVTTVFGRLGNITAASGDYTANQITETATKVFLSPAEKASIAGKADKATTIGGYGITDFNSLGDARWLRSDANNTAYGYNLNFSNYAPITFGDNQDLKISSSGGSALIDINNAGTLRFRNGTSDLITIARTSGNLGIGTSSPTANIHVFGSTANSTVGGDTGGILRLTNTYAGSFGSGGEIQFGYQGGSVNKVLSLIKGVYSDYNATSSGGELQFFTQPAAGTLTKRMNISSSGDVGIVKNVTAAAFFESSDERLKTNIEPISDTFRSFELKNTEGKRYGVIAQEIEATNPELIRKDDEGMLSVNYTDLLCMKLAEMENKVKEQDDKIARLEAMVEQLLNKK